MENENEQRVLARVKRLGAIREHPNADRLNIAEVDGWNVVVPKTLATGDLGVYFEIDSCLPLEAPWVKENNLGDVKVIKTKQIRGELSQGLFLPISSVPLDASSVAEGDDVTKLLNITKRPEAIIESAKGPNVPRGHQFKPFSEVLPFGPPKTDEPRIQSYMFLRDALVGHPWVATLKYDGCSATFFYKTDAKNEGGELVVLSRNFQVTDTDTHYWKTANKYSLTEKLANRPDIAIQAEIYGPGINKNRMGMREFKMAVFNVYSFNERKFLDWKEAQNVCESLNLPTAQVIASGEAFPETTTVPELLKMAEGTYDGTTFPREGIVVRPQVEMKVVSKNERLRLSFKVINNTYLLAVK